MTENCSYYLKMAKIVLVWLFRDFAKMDTIVLDTIVLIDCIEILLYDPNASYWLLNFQKSYFLSAGSKSHKNVKE